MDTIFQFLEVIFNDLHRRILDFLAPLRIRLIRAARSWRRGRNYLSNGERLVCINKMTNPVGDFLRLQGPSGFQESRQGFGRGCPCHLFYVEVSTKPFLLGAATDSHFRLQIAAARVRGVPLGPRPPFQPSRSPSPGNSLARKASQLLRLPAYSECIGRSSIGRCPQ